jgi:hypothetical protein
VRVLDDGRVVPTTGVFLADQTVLVPSEFIAGDHALLALDGGADLDTHGRVATVIRRLPLAGLAVLEVPGLRGPAPRLASGPLREGQGVLLQALAPPDLLARGEARVQRAGRIVRLADGGVSLDPSTPLPNVTGVLVDGCGQWVGYSAARGVASMSTSSATLYQWVPDLSSRLEEAGFLPESGPCAVDAFSLSARTDSLAETSTSPGSKEESLTGEGADTILNTGPEREHEAAPETEPERESGVAGIPVDFPELVPDPEPYAGPAIEVPTEGAPESTGTLARYGPWILIAAVLALVAFGWYRFRRATPAPVMQQVAFVLEGENERLRVLSHDGEVNCVIGRFDVDLVIEAVTVSRRHARLFGTHAGLQFMDLGSTNGTRVNGQPCAARVAVTVSPGDRLRFGDQEYVLQSASGSGA